MLEHTMQVANGMGMWIAALIMVSVVVIQAVMFTRLASKEAKNVNFSGKNVMKSFKSGMITALGPSIAQFVALISLIVVIGSPMAWMNLSIIGSASTDLTVATISAESMGSGLGMKNFSLEALAVVLFCLALNGCVWQAFIVITTPKMNLIQHKLGGGDITWMKLITAAANIAVFSNMASSQAVRGSKYLGAVLGGFFVMLLVNQLAKRHKSLVEYKLAISIILGLIIAGIVSAIL